MKTVISLTLILVIFSKNCKAQIQPKVLWETVVDSSVYYYGLELGGFLNGQNIKISPKGNFLIAFPNLKSGLSGNAQFRAIAQDGKIKWKSEDFFRNNNSVVSTANTKNGFNLRAYLQYPNTFEWDNTFLFDNEFNLINRFKAPYVFVCDDGWIYEEVATNSFHKYNSKGELEWIYKDPKNRKLLLRQLNYPYVFFAEIGSFSLEVIMLKATGKLRNAYKVITANHEMGSIGTIKPEGCWWAKDYSDYDLHKLVFIDSTGMELQTILLKDLMSREVYTQSMFHISDKNNSLFISYVKNNEIYVTKINAKGQLLSLNTQYIIDKTTPNYYLNSFIPTDENTLIFQSPYTQKSSNEVSSFQIGLLNFGSPASSWSKKIYVGDNNSLVDNFTINSDKTFLQISSVNDTSAEKELYLYDSLGEVKWRGEVNIQKNGFYDSKITNQYAYFKRTNSALTKIRLADGKVVWNQENINITNFRRSIIETENGNNVVFYYRIENNQYKQYISLIQLDGTTKWTYTLPHLVESDNIIDFSLVRGKLILSTLELVGNQYQQVLRKITPCSYNFSDKVALPDSGITTLVANSSQRILCNNEKVSLTAPKYDGVMYEWRRDGQVFASGTSSTQEVNQSGTYQVAIKDTLCLYSGISNALKFTVPQKVSLAIDAPSTSVCEGEKITLAAKTTENSYFWQKDSQFIASTSPVLEPTSSGFYRLASYNEQCKDSTFSNTIAITIKPLPDATVEMEAKGNVFNKPSVKLTAKTGNGIGYQWYKDDVIIPNATRSYYESYVSGVYKVNLTQNGCTQTSNPLEINIFVPLANEKEESETQIKVYPNPSNGQFSVTLPEYLVGANLELFDGLGKKIDGMVNHETINTSNSLPAGTYVLKITKNEKITSMKVIIE